MCRQSARPTADVKHLVACPHTRERREGRRERLGVSAHETGVRLRRNGKTHHTMLCRRPRQRTTPPLAGFLEKRADIEGRRERTVISSAGLDYTLKRNSTTSPS